MNRLRNTRKPGCSRTDAATACIPSKGWPTRGNKVRFPRMAGNGFLRPLYNKFRNTRNFGYRAIRFFCSVPWSVIPFLFPWVSPEKSAGRKP